MAFTFRALSSQQGSGTSSVVTKPAGTASGDLLLAAVAISTSASVTPPAGWTLIRTDNVNSAVYLHTFSLVAGGSEPASYTFTFGASVNHITHINGFAGGTNPSVDLSSGNTGVSSSWTATGVTTSAANDLLLGVFSGQSSFVVTPPSGMTESGDLAQGTQLRLECAYLLDAGAAGATGNKVASGQATFFAAQLIAVKLVGSVDATGTATVGTAAAAGGSQAASVTATGTTTKSNAAASGNAQMASVSTPATGVTTKSNAAASGGAHGANANVLATTTKSNAAAAGGSHTAATSYTGTTTKGTAAASGGAHTAQSSATGAVTKGSASAAGGAITATIGYGATLTPGSAAAAGGLLSAFISNDALISTGAANAAGGDHVATAIADALGLIAAGFASARGGLVTADIFRLARRYTQLGGNIVQLGSRVPLGYESLSIQEDRV